jgi:hypothetical protein
MESRVTEKWYLEWARRWRCHKIHTHKGKAVLVELDTVWKQAFRFLYDHVICKISSFCKT